MHFNTLQFSQQQSINNGLVIKYRGGPLFLWMQNEWFKKNNPLGLGDE